MTRARALRDVNITDIVDKHSSCAQSAKVNAVVYESKSASSDSTIGRRGRVSVHPDFEMVAGTRQEEKRVFWNNADLAVITLEDPMPREWPCVALSRSEVEVGDSLVIAGYGPGDSDELFGLRHTGENVVTRVARLETGTVLFGVPASLGADHKARAQARRGDSGGAGVRKDDRNVLIGVVAMDSEAPAGTGSKMSWFTSIYPYRRWLAEIVRQVNLATDAGVSSPDSDAGSAP